MRSFEVALSSASSGAAGATPPPADMVAAIAGKYRLLRKCGGACGSLHKRQKAPAKTTAKAKKDSAADADDDDMYLFIDPDRTGPAEEDGYVFSSSHRRLQLGEVCVCPAKHTRSILLGRLSFVDSCTGTARRRVRACVRDRVAYRRPRRGS